MAKPTSKSRRPAAPRKAAAAKRKVTRKKPLALKRKPAAPARRKSPAAAPPDLFQARIADYRGKPGTLISLLQAAQEAYGYIPEAAIRRIHLAVGVPLAEIYGVITFYSQFRLKPLGKYLIKMCDGTACHVNGSERLAGAIEDELRLGGGDTTADGLFTLQKVACLGCCSLSPVIMINGETYGRLTPKKVQQLLKEFKSRAQKSQTA